MRGDTFHFGPLPGCFLIGEEATEPFVVLFTIGRVALVRCGIVGENG